MLLRRFTQHVKEQNWFVVGLDVLVVITGIFLGMQVTEWNQSLKDQHLEQQYLQRLLNDAERSIAHQNSVIKGTKSRIVNMSMARKMLFDKTISKENLSEFVADLMNVYPWLTTEFYFDTLDELYSSGRSTLIAKEKTREIISRFRTEAKINLEAQKNVGAVISGLYAELNHLFVWSPDGNLVNSVEELNSSRAIYQAIDALVGTQSRLVNYGFEMHELTVKFRGDIQAALTPCSTVKDTQSKVPESECEIN